MAHRAPTLSRPVSGGEATEQEIMSASGHRSPEAARVYIKRTEKQRIAAIRKRRDWVQTVSTKRAAAGAQ
jgi:hypothetical protein